MKIDINEYEIVSKVFLGTNLKITINNCSNRTNRKVLVLKEVAGFIDTINTSKKIETLRLDEEGGSYNLDLSIRLKNPEVAKFPEVLIFVDKTCVDFCFRAVAKTIEFRDWTEKDDWLP